jgi:hypothetical protein
MEGKWLKEKILVYDDERQLAATYVRRLKALSFLKERFEVEPITPNAFEKEMNALESRRRAFRKKNDSYPESLLDEVSILIIDYDLLESFNPFITGESVSYLGRCYSKCGLIIGMNQYDRRGQPTSFDLTLKGHPESFADLNICSEQLDNPGLWSEKRNLFRPWHWPQLPHFLQSFQKRVKDVEAHLEEPICKTLDIENIETAFPDSISTFLGNHPAKKTFREFVESSGNGLKPRDENKNEELVARIAAARISKWLERLVLPGQDILVDAPHLISRFPSLLEADPLRIDAWNRTTSLDGHDGLGLDHNKIQAYELKKDFWLSRPAWFWQKLSESRNIKEVSAPWERKETKFGFCEDTSRFHRQKACTEFYAELASPFRRRFVYGVDGIEYEPAVQLIRSGMRRVKSGARRVRPSVRHARPRTQS